MSSLQVLWQRAKCPRLDHVSTRNPSVRVITRHGWRAMLILDPLNPTRSWSRSLHAQAPCSIPRPALPHGMRRNLRNTAGGDRHPSLFRRALEPAQEGWRRVYSVDLPDPSRPRSVSPLVSLWLQRLVESWSLVTIIRNSVQDLPCISNSLTQAFAALMHLLTLYHTYNLYLDIEHYLGDDLWSRGACFAQV